MSSTDTFLLSPNTNSQQENAKSEKIYYRSGLRGKHILLGVCVICSMYLIVLGNLVTLVLIASFLRLNSQGSSHFSFVADNTLRLHSPLSAEKTLVEGQIQSDVPLTISSLSDLQLGAGVLLFDEAGVLSQTSVLSLTEDSVSTHNLTNHLILRTPYSDHESIFLSADVRINSSVRAEELSADSGFEVGAVEGTDSLLIQGPSDVTLQGGRGVLVSTQSTLITAHNSTISLQASSINITAAEYLLARELPADKLPADNVTSPQLRLCACEDGTLFLLRHSSSSCRVRGSILNLC